MSTWKFITNYGIVLAYVARHPDALAEDIAMNIGVRVRTIRRIIAELVADGYLEKESIGRRNRYRVNLGAPLRRSILGNAKVADILDMLMPLLEIQK